MAKVSEVARAALAAISSDSSYLLASQWVNERYADVAAHHKLRHLREVLPLVTAAAITTDTVTTTNGSRVVTGTSTAAAAWAPSIVGRYFRSRNAWYRVENFDAVALTLLLDKTYAEDSGSGQSYVIAERFVPLAKDVRWIGDPIIQGRTRTQLWRQSRTEFDINNPGRILEKSKQPWFWSEAGSGFNSDGEVVKLIEIYPPTEDAEIFYYLGWKTPAKLDLDSELPIEIDINQLKEGVLIDVMRDMMAKSAKANQIEQAALWRNEYRAQQTMWKDVRRTIAQSDNMAADDATFILETIGGVQTGGDVKTARDEVFIRGARP